jgi:hypothetical protein
MTTYRHSGRKSKSAEASAPRLFTSPPAVPPPAPPPADPAPLATPDALVLAHVRDRCQEPPHRCVDSAATIAAATGLPAEAVKKVRRDLIALGVLLLEQLPGLAPRVALARWPLHSGLPGASRMPLWEHLDRSRQVLTLVTFEVGQASRLYGELGQSEKATALAGILEQLHDAAADLEGVIASDAGSELEQLAGGAE